MDKRVCVVVSCEKIVLKSSRTGSCSTCGKRTSRTLRVFQTLDPHNKNAQGELKTRTEIYAELRRQIAERRELPLYCRRCELLLRVDINAEKEGDQNA